MTHTTPTLTSSAILVELSIGTWTARKLDKKVTEEVNTTKRASAAASRVNKNLLADVKQLDEITKYAASVRNWMYTQTLPWSDFGARLIPTAEFFEFKQKLDAHEQEFNQMVEAFVTEYPNLISMQAFKLGQMFDRDEYPTPEEVADKFKFRVAYMPVPEAGDFRVDIGNEAMADLRAQYEADFTQRMADAMGDVRKRLLESLSKLSDRLADTDEGKRKTLHKRTLESVAETIAQVRQLNLTRDEAIEAMASQAESVLKHADLDVIKEQDTTRHKVREQINGILGAFDF